MMKLYFYTAFIGLLLSFSSAHAESIANCVRYNTPITTYGANRPYNVKCEYIFIDQTSPALGTVAGTLKFAHPEYAGEIAMGYKVINSGTYSYHTQVLAFLYSPKLEIMNSECTVRHNANVIVLADCPNSTSQLHIKVKADIVETHQYYSSNSSRVLRGALSVPTFVSSIATGGSGASNPPPSNPPSNNYVAGPWHRYSACARECEDTGIGSCVKQARKYYCR